VEVPVVGDAAPVQFGVRTEGFEAREDTAGEGVGDDAWSWEWFLFSPSLSPLLSPSTAMQCSGEQFVTYPLQYSGDFHVTFPISMQWVQLRNIPHCIAVGMGYIKSPLQCRGECYVTFFSRALV